MSDVPVVEPADKWFVGQQVWLIRPNRYNIEHLRPQQVAVTKVGRKYVTVRGRQFHIDSGWEFVRNYSSTTRIETDQMRTERLRREEAVKALCEAGLDIRRGFNFTSQQVEAILSVIGGGSGV